MQNDDQSTQKPEDVEKNSSAENDKAGQRPLQHYWKEHLKAIMLTVLQMCKKLAGKAKSAYAGFFKVEGDVSPMEDIKAAFRHIPLKKKGLSFLFAGFLFTVYLFSGVYTVKPGEVAVSTIFGKEARQSITEGLHYRLPWPFEAVEKVNVSAIRRVDVGISPSEEPLLFPKKRSSVSSPDAGEHSGHGGQGAFSETTEAPESVSVSAKNQFFTGDENILDIRMNIQYQIKDAADYLFNMNSPDSLVPSAARVAVTEFFGQMQLEDLLTVAKSQIQKRIALKTQNMLDAYGTGLYIVNVNLQEVNPPKEVAQAFRDVSSAKEQREEKINKAQGYRNALIPEARGQAHKMISEAEGYKQEVINRARGDAEKFSAMLREYRRAKVVTEYRLYLETIETVLAKARKFVVDSQKERVNLKFVK